MKKAIKQNTPKTHVALSLLLVSILFLQSLFGLAFTASAEEVLDKDLPDESLDVDVEKQEDKTDKELDKEINKDKDTESGGYSDDDYVLQKDESSLGEKDDKDILNKEGQMGDEGEDGKEGDGEVNLLTGSSVAILEIDNKTNTNLINETKKDGNNSENNGKENATSGKPLPKFYSDIEGDKSSFIASSSNKAVISNKATTTSSSGVNYASGTPATIITGDAIAVANVVNLANTNIINSQGFINFFSLLGYSDIDLRNIFSIFDFVSDGVAMTTDPCLPSVCGVEEDFLVQNHSTATLENYLQVYAETGGNMATGNGDTLINTGNAYASANVTNMVNTNIVDSNYLLLSFDNFGDLSGDIVLPNADFFSDIFRQVGGAVNASVHNENLVDIDNQLEAVTQTGNNTASGGGVIMTGDGSTGANVVNKVNQNLLGGSSFLLLLRVHGDWSGEVFGLPEGMAWKETPQGIELYQTGEVSGGESGHSSLNVNNHNQATINNNVSVYALTGENKIHGEGDSVINTGDAYANASIVNIANTNVLGQNWAMLIFDIFGNWNGNLAFGRPDLWVGARAETNGNLMPGSEFTYIFTVTNLGDTNASEVVLDKIFDRDELELFGVEFLSDEDGRAVARRNIGTVASGETVEYSYTARVSDRLPRIGKRPIDLEVTISARESEDNLDNNTDKVTVYAGRNFRSSGQVLTGHDSLPANLEVTKTADVLESLVPGVINYTLKIKNTGGPVYNAYLFDRLTDPNGVVIDEQRWNLETILANELITIEYSTEFATSSDLGIYTNEAQVVGLHRSKKLTDETIYMSSIARVSIELTDTLLEEPEPMVLGEKTCEEYLTGYSRYGKNNDSADVARLQSFLNEHLSMQLTVNGEFDKYTKAAVEVFQFRHRDSVLKPWGLAEPSGYVYITTRNTINNIVCEGVKEFPLTKFERLEIASYWQSNTLSLSSDQFLPPVVGTGDFSSDTAISIQTENQVSVRSGNENRFGILKQYFDNIPLVESSKYLNRGIFSSLMSDFRSWLRQTLSTR